MATWNPPTFAAFAKLKAADLALVNAQISRISDDECSLNSDTSGVSNTTLVSTNLSRPVAASATYKGILEGVYSASTTGDIKFGLLVPSGTTITRAQLLSGPSSETTNIAASVYFGTDTNISAMSAPGAGTGTIVWCRLWVRFVTSITAGNAQIQFAQATTDGANSTILRAGSSWWVKRIDGV